MHGGITTRPSCAMRLLGAYAVQLLQETWRGPCPRRLPEAADFALAN